MPKYPEFAMTFNIPGSNKDRIDACEFYIRAFNGKRISEVIPPGGDQNTSLHIWMEINGFSIMLGPAQNKDIGSALTCTVHFDKEDALRKAYKVLIEGGQNYSIQAYPWTRLGATVTDKYGISWWLDLVSAVKTIQN